MVILINHNDIIIIKVYLALFPRLKTLYHQIIWINLLTARGQQQWLTNVPISFLTVIKSDLIKYNLC